MKTKVKLLDPRAVVPSRAHDTDSGYDIKMIDVKKIVGDVIFFRTGVSLQPPPGYYYRVYPRSSISNYSVALANSVAVIDETFTGELLIPLRVFRGEGFQETLKMSPKTATLEEVATFILENKPVICQIILEKRYDAEFEVVEELSQTERGEGGFGSTDKKY